jgi:hypothetical protein
MNIGEINLQALRKSKLRAVSGPTYFIRGEIKFVGLSAFLLKSTQKTRITFYPEKISVPKDKRFFSNKPKMKLMDGHQSVSK